jgi:hypothetical protein
MLKGIIIMKTQEFKNKAQEALLECLTEVPFLTVKERITQAPESERPDILMLLKVDDQEQILLIEMKNNGQPRYARQVVNQILRYQDRYPKAYGIFMAPYISPQSEAICREANVGFVDLAGNCHISFQTIYIYQTGKPNPYSQKRDLRSLYSPKAERILRVLLAYPSNAWKVEELASEADVSIGHVANIKKLLADHLWIEDFSVGFSLKEPEALLEEWSENYRFSRNKLSPFYTMDKLSDFEYRLGEICEREGVHYGLTGFSGAARLSPAVRYQRAMAYVNCDLDRLVDLLELKSVTSGANVALLTPYDEGVFFEENKIGGLRVLHPIQIYLDLKSMRGRGDEAAEVLLKEVIRKEW